MDNEVLIHVRVKNDGKIGFESFAKDADEKARTISQSFATRLTENIRVNFAERMPRILGGPGAGAAAPEVAGGLWGRLFGKAASENISEHITTRITQDVNGRWHDALTGRFLSGGADGGNGGRGGRGGEGGRGGDAKVNVDVDKQSMLSRFFGAGKEAAGKFGEGFKDSVGNLFSGDIISMVVKGVAAGGLAVLLASVLGAAITSAIGLALGGGVIGIGIAGAFKDPRVLTAATDLKTKITGMFKDFGLNFSPAVLHFFTDLGGVIKQIKPMIDEIGKTFGPVADSLESGIIGFLQNALPGILRATEGAAPIIQMLANKLPGLGDDIGRFFDHIKNGMPDAALFFGDLIDAVGIAIRVIGNLIQITTRMYGVVRQVFVGLVRTAADWAVGITSAASAAFGWVPGLGPKLDAAAHKAAQFKNSVNKQLSSINDVDVQVRIRVIGTGLLDNALRLGNLLKARGYIGNASGGIVGAATGGLHGGVRMVGEHGPELVELPPGTRVNSNEDSMRMMAAAGAGAGGQPFIVQLVLDGKVLAQQLVEPTRDIVRSLGRGSVQKFYGQPGVA